MLRELAGKNGFAMWCPGRLCITTPSMFEELENPFGKDDDKMYPTKVGGSHVDEKKFKNLKECLSYCSEEFTNTIGMAIGKEAAKAAVTLILAILAAIVSIFLPAFAATAGILLASHLSGFFRDLAISIIIIFGIVIPYFTIYRPCVKYCYKVYKS